MRAHLHFGVVAGRVSPPPDLCLNLQHLALQDLALLAECLLQLQRLLPEEGSLKRRQPVIEYALKDQYFVVQPLKLVVELRMLTLDLGQVDGVSDIFRQLPIGFVLVREVHLSRVRSRADHVL